jgi:hypothetical protein
MHSPNVSQGDAVLCDGPPKHQISEQSVLQINRMGFRLWAT